MKIVLFLLAVLVLLWLLRGSARRLRSGKPTAVPPALPMATCLQCGLHLPRDEALPGKGGVFCGDRKSTRLNSSHQ